MDIQSILIGAIFGILLAFTIVIYFHTSAHASTSSIPSPPNPKKSKKKIRKSNSSLPRPTSLNTPSSSLKNGDDKAQHQTKGLSGIQAPSYASIAKKEDPKPVHSSNSIYSENMNGSSISKQTTKQQDQVNQQVVPLPPQQRTMPKKVDSDEHDDNGDEETKSTYAAKTLRIMPSSKTPSSSSSWKSHPDQLEVTKKQRENQRKRELEKQHKADAQALQEQRLRQHRAEQERIRSENIRSQMLAAEQERLMRKGAFLESQR